MKTFILNGGLRQSEQPQRNNEKDKCACGIEKKADHSYPTSAVPITQESRGPEETDGSVMNKTEHVWSPDKATNSLCPSSEYIRSPWVNKLGQYPSTKRHMTIGLTTITRPNGVHYLSETIQSLLDSMDEENRKQTFIVVFLADFDRGNKQIITTNLSKLFHREIEEDILHVIETSPKYYPQLTNLKEKFGDSKTRIYWRSKQNIDFAFLMCYCHELSNLYLHVEDDVKASPSVFHKLQGFISSQRKPWPMLDISYMGHTAKVYHSEDLRSIASYFYLLYAEMPGDWLIRYWRLVKVPENAGFILPAASLFQHHGVHSSLQEKSWPVNKTYDRYFDVYDHKYWGKNPSAEVSSSITPNQGKPQDAYRSGLGYLWGRNVKQDDHVTVRFNSVVNASKVFVDTGSNLAMKDFLRSGVLQASFVSGTNSSSCGKFDTVVPFKDGRAQAIFNKMIYCLRILVTKDQNEWLFLREINVWEAERLANVNL
ncbi:alpha-1,3-mannosyl-glycoprotein 4-beta-N-acetylglucosaminyltransferase C-like [Stylophora pistillata]|uniref:alpha-1,3-mannosyl-glycoprotein 4-beta-N-acetylglucosaminyltransferase C-like n=1 Tax=Stylophora pistillata TaxID=50429 RepID=UPI000C045B38|nr:alpha-1,3-mannosyl-glycoprotein 4-beta-N-acetylglucosaminyltransferase C-like [Stylophora pistillata]